MDLEIGNEVWDLRLGLFRTSYVIPTEKLYPLSWGVFFTKSTYEKY